LTHVASRQTLAAGALRNTPAELAAWLRDPEQFKPGSHMPNLQLKPDNIRLLTAYLETLR
jgi:cytochrome c oxidase subunit 2